MSITQADHLAVHAAQDAAFLAGDQDEVQRLQRAADHMEEEDRRLFWATAAHGERSFTEHRAVVEFARAHKLAPEVVVERAQIIWDYLAIHSYLDGWGGGECARCLRSFLAEHEDKIVF